MELATLAAPRKPARGREGGGAEIMEKYGGKKGGKEERHEEQRKRMHLYSGTDA